MTEEISLKEYLDFRFNQLEKKIDNIKDDMTSQMKDHKDNHWKITTITVSLAGIVMGAIKKLL